MAHLTQLDQAALASLCADFGIGALHDSGAIAAGTINSNYQVETSQGRFFLRVNEGKTRSQVEYEVAVLDFFAGEGIPCPLPRTARDGQPFVERGGKFISLFDWVAGQQVDSSSIGENHCRAMGQRIAQLHRAGKQAPARLLREGRYSFAALVERFENIRSSSDPNLTEPLAILAAEIDYLQGQRAEREERAAGLVHADLFPDNLLFEGEDICALLDFEQACRDTLVYDLAIAINAWCFARGFRQERLRALLDGYRGAEGGEDLAGLYTELRAAAMRFTVTRLTDVYLPGERDPAKDFRRFLMRLQHWRTLGEDGLARLISSFD